MTDPISNQPPESAKFACDWAVGEDVASPAVDFAADETGAVTVDWTVLSGVAVSLALGTAGIMTDITGMLSNNMNDELADGDISDGWPEFNIDYVDEAIAAGIVTSADAAVNYEAAFGMMNNAIILQIDAGIAALEAGTLTDAELAQLIAVASVAYDRNLVPAAPLDYYFGFDGSDAYYLQLINQPTG